MGNEKLTEAQECFIGTVIEGRNVFLTGKAGTGKSFIVRQAIKELKSEGRKVIAVAPTGIAANNIDGQTIHSMFKLTPYGVLSFETCNFMKSDSRDVLRKADTIIIDEVSMLRPDVLDGMHWTLKKNGLPGLDEKQLIFVGDLKQLPVILDDNTRSVLYQTYDGDTFGYAKIYKKLKVDIVELTEVLRQDNPEFIHALNVVREGGKHEYFRQFVHTEPRGVVLAPHNETVAMYNRIGLDAQPGQLFTFKAKIDENVKATDFNLESEIQVKNGCKIMYLVNSKNNPLRNGTLGTFVSHNDCHYIRIDGVDYALEMYRCSKKEYVYDKHKDELVLRDLGGMEQYPFKLAYALSIHKSQGLTFDECTVDLRRPCFQKGQQYVALSRVRTPDGLRIII